MECLQIIGGRPLHGTVTVSGSKNAALPILAASILASEPVRLLGVPDLADVNTLVTVLDQLGVRAIREPGGDIQIESVDHTPVRAGYEFVRRMRASFCVLGPLLARRGRAVVSLPGGCNLGPRPVDLHLRALEALGAEINIAHGYVVARANRLRGARVNMLGAHGPTVTGTTNVLCAAVLAQGTTIIDGAAMEPEIVDLGHFLQTIGAQIEGFGTDKIVVRGVSSLGGATHRVISDRIEAGTLLIAAAIARGNVCIDGINPPHLTSLLELLTSVGATLSVEPHRVRIAFDGIPKASDVSTAAFPGLASDLQAQWMALMSVASGTSWICERVFPQRFMHVAELRRFRANIELAGSTATVRGVPRLSAAEVKSPDLRAGAALVLAGLAARGRTIVHGLEHLDRGYERLEAKLSGLGADISRVHVERNAARPTVAAL